MHCTYLAKIVIGCAASASIASAALAQGRDWVPGSELVGQTVRVETDGIVNIVSFEPNGLARISSPTNARTIDATWTADGEQMCLATASSSDCYPYSEAFIGFEPVDLISNCGVRSRWTAMLPAAENG